MELDSGEFFLYDDLEIDCWDDTHLGYVLFLGLPALIVWILLLPSIILLILIRYRKLINEYSMKTKLGFLYNGFKPKYYYWEMILLYRKIFVAFIAVFMSSGNT
mmetsp:Transcript_19934/g.3253  ORF Transcript_19934/g.3253 Transcript_19934/m.3253 type:complete len:104 (-) Transcript_19934:61-372(-)